ncbi:hypothetical protein [Calidithermus terrae]|nr:hypothetical protein [Calidithermus terrae]
MRLLRRFAALTAVCLGLAAASPGMLREFLTKLNTAWDSGHYLSALVQAETAFRGPPPGHDGAFFAQVLAWARSYVGDTQGAREAFGSAFPAGTATEIPAGARQEEAVGAIVRAAKERRVVILNEAHHVPMHRAFALRLALALREEGFTHFAAETFLPGVAELARKGYPSLGMGHYSKEPVFGDLIRNAMRVGYRLVPYEPEGDVQSIEAREQAQADNLQRILQRDPTARVLVYAGFHHVFESPDPLGNVWMAQRLKDLAGIDPLTIDQTTEAAFPVTTSAVLRSANGVFVTLGQYAGRVDIQVLHPREVLVGGRPSWLREWLGRKPVEVPSALLPVAQRVLVQAFVAGEGSDAVPFDQIVAEPGRKLMLTPGRYELVSQDDMGRILARRSLEVR